MNEKLVMFQNRLTKVFKHVSKIAKKQSVTCYRVYDHDLPEFPFCIEIYEDKIYLAEYKRRHHLTEEEHEDWLDACMEIMESVIGISVDKIYLKQRQRKAGRLGQYQRVAHEGEFFIVKEAGLNFRVNLTDYLDTGLFLDHRITREMVRQEASDKHVLNLFSYTSSFSVYAASGGADTVTSVDLSKTYLNWSEINMKINDLYDENKHFYVHADVKQYLDELKPNHFDLVILDPPTFSNSKRMKDFLDIQRDHVELINGVLRSMKVGGTLYFSNNYRQFVLEEDRIQASSIKNITGATTPFDFQGKLFRWCYKIIK